jgi:transcriptional regulator with XRE-family HTH domain
MIFQEKLCVLRARAGLTQEALAERLGVSRQAVAKWEKGLSVPDPEKLLKLCAIFGVCADYLLGATPNKQISLPLLNDEEAVSCLSLFHSRPELKTLFSETRNASKEELIKAVNVLRALFSKE